VIPSLLRSSAWDEKFFEPHFPDAKEIIAAGGKVEGSTTEFHCVNGICDGKVNPSLLLRPSPCRHPSDAVLLQL
jgi:hypothetical protein